MYTIDYALSSKEYTSFYTLKGKLDNFRLWERFYFRIFSFNFDLGFGLGFWSWFGLGFDLGFGLGRFDLGFGFKNMTIYK